MGSATSEDVSDDFSADTSGELPGSTADPDTVTHDIVMPAHLRDAIAADWDPAPPMPHPARTDLQPFAARRRDAVSTRFAGHAVVVPGGRLTPRANDTDYPFRAASSFVWLTGETIDEAVLVMTPEGSGHRSVLYVGEYAAAGELGYFTSRTHGALWVGNVPTPAETQAALGLTTRPRTELRAALAALHDVPVALLAGVDPEVDAAVPGAATDRLPVVLDELRLVKDDWELARLQDACDATTRGFADVVRELPVVLQAGGRRGERWLEGTFWRRARMEGNEVGYSSILASGRHATTLHWWRDNGDIAEGQLLLADMGVETDELYTADVTRTLPISGTWTPEQRRVYSAVLEAQTAGIAEVKAGADFQAAHRAAMWVIADHLHSWGILPVTAEVSCAEDPDRPGAGLHRRYTLHSTSHMLGIDVHDCAAARNEVYRDGALAAGYVLTVEPGLYFQVNDRSVPPELRGIGVRIEDDVAVTDGAPLVLSSALPTDPDLISEWMRETQATPARP